MPHEGNHRTRVRLPAPPPHFKGDSMEMREFTVPVKKPFISKWLKDQRLAEKDGVLEHVPPCSDCNERDEDCNEGCPNLEECDALLCCDCKFKEECNTDMGLTVEEISELEGKEEYLNITSLSIEEIDNGWLLYYGESKGRHFKDTKSICEFISDHLSK